MVVLGRGGGGRGEEEGDGEEGGRGRGGEALVSSSSDESPENEDGVVTQRKTTVSARHQQKTKRGRTGTISEKKKQSPDHIDCTVHTHR